MMQRVITVRIMAIWLGLVACTFLFGPAQIVLTGAEQGTSAEGHRFVAHTITEEMQGGYQSVITDLNRDGRPDVIAVSLGLDELSWYENPGWQKHVLVSGLNRPINLAAQDLDGDGIPELAVVHEFGTSHEGSLGILSLLTHAGDPTTPWSLQEIDRTPTAHRVRWADIDGSGNHEGLDFEVVVGCRRNEVVVGVALCIHHFMARVEVVLPVVGISVLDLLPAQHFTARVDDFYEYIDDRLILAFDVGEVE